MKAAQKTYMRLFLLVAFALFVAMPLATPNPSALAQSGGSYAIRPSASAGGGGASTNASASVEGTIGQNILGTSANVPLSINSGFWPNAAVCPFAVAPTAQFFTMAGGSGSVNVMAASVCGWNATVSDSWISITSEVTGAGNGVVTFETRENFTGSARQGSITFTGRNHIIVQDGGLGDECGYSINPLFQSFPASGGIGSVNVAAGERCAWQAVASDEWITITSINVGIGTGTVSFSVATNPGPSARKASIVIGGKSFSVKQK